MARPVQIGPLLYSLSISFVAGVSSFLIVLVAEQFIEDKEKAVGYALVWFFSLPWILMSGLVGLATYGRYRAQVSWGGATVVFLATVAIAIVVGTGLDIVFRAISR